MPIGLRFPDWAEEGASWPHAEHSRFVSAGRHRWHVQRFGRGPGILLLHGTAASTHSFAEVAGALAEGFEVMAVDLPGHGFTRSPGLGTVSPRTVAEGLGALLDAEGFAPAVIVGHSAGAVVAHELAAAGRAGLVVSINGAYRSFEGLARFIAPALAKMFYYNPLTAVAFAQAAKDEARVRRLIEQTGSSLPEGNVRLYARLLRYPGHVSGALAMMAGWDLDGIEARIRSAHVPVLFVLGEGDTAVPPKESRRLARDLPGASVLELPGRGHLVHEEDPARVAAAIRDAAIGAGILPPEKDKVHG